GGAGLAAGGGGGGGGGAGLAAGGGGGAGLAGAAAGGAPFGGGPFLSFSASLGAWATTSGDAPCCACAVTLANCAADSEVVASSTRRSLVMVIWIPGNELWFLAL